MHIEPNPGPRCPEAIRLVVEIPRNSSNKYEYDPELGVFKLSRALYSPMHYPGDYGYVPGTVAEDGDPLDVLALLHQPTFPGCVYEVRPVGVLDMLDEGIPDHKILAVPVREPRSQPIVDIDDVPEHTRREIEHFFEIYKELEGKSAIMQGFRSAGSARNIVSQSRSRYLAEAPSSAMS